jgi:hypothetical protein
MFQFRPLFFLLSRRYFSKIFIPKTKMKKVTINSQVSLCRYDGQRLQFYPVMGVVIAPGVEAFAEAPPEHDNYSLE